MVGREGREVKVRIDWFGHWMKWNGSEMKIISRKWLEGINEMEMCKIIIFE